MTSKVTARIVAVRLAFFFSEESIDSSILRRSARTMDALSPPELSPLEQEVLEEYERLAENMKTVSNDVLFFSSRAGGRAAGATGALGLRPQQHNNDNNGGGG